MSTNHEYEKQEENHTQTPRQRSILSIHIDAMYRRESDLECILNFLGPGVVSPPRETSEFLRR